MKGLSETIIIVITAVVILVAALVLLTIFGGGIGQVTPLTQARTICISQGQMAGCSGDAQWNKPVTWDIPTLRTDAGMVSCGAASGTSQGLGISCTCAGGKITSCS